ncbi:hypothetical protein KY385_04795 [Candidatus Parcubacteria bacterium]|nr:hypothetical protein [Candidatus Parcubacteria bacterium]
MPETGAERVERNGESSLCDLGLGNGSRRLLMGVGGRIVILHERVRREGGVNDSAAALGRVSAGEFRTPTGD